MEYIYITDAWSSDVSSDALLGFTAHWIDSNFHRKSAVHIPRNCQRHPGECIAMKIVKILEEWNIALPQVHVVIRDNGKSYDRSKFAKFWMFSFLPTIGSK